MPAALLENLLFGAKQTAAVPIQSHYGDHSGTRGFSSAVIISRIWMLMARSLKWREHFLHVAMLCCNCNMFRDFRSRVSRLGVHGCDRMCMCVCVRESVRVDTGCLHTKKKKKGLFFFCQSLGYAQYNHSCHGRSCGFVSLTSGLLKQALWMGSTSETQLSSLRLLYNPFTWSNHSALSFNQYKLIKSHVVNPPVAKNQCDSHLWLVSRFPKSRWSSLGAYVIT